ncbi:hypothetical protein QAD02_003440 [Eretmocerus hayati]|uniref:Uncharacterized protein n=1 Tax=Eretmocerus hayati TaxID=131215 RepID=A0ACC2NMP4_9HYME|nr:hypothetical protein QAD02_003440 [Eretmocerus hayati]
MDSFLTTTEELNQTISYLKYRLMLVRLTHCLIQLRMTRGVDVKIAPHPTGDISTPEGPVLVTQESVESLVLKLDSSYRVLSGDSVRTGKRGCVNDSAESCGHQRRRTLSEDSVMDEQMDTPAVDNTMEQSSQPKNFQLTADAGAHPGAIDPP